MPQDPAAERFVLVTGASTGIGRAIAELAAARGWRVLAGVRRARDAEALAGPGVQPLLLDVTDEESVRAAAAAAERACGPAGLRGLVNNAGIAIVGPIEHLPLAAFREQMEVNFFGAVRVTQALLPLLRRARGRIVMVSSQSGRIALPLLGPYSASKFALEGLSDALRLELAPLGVGVSLLQPGAVATPIWRRSEDRAMALRSSLATAAADYAPLIAAFGRGARAAEAAAVPPADCAAAALQALEARRAPVRVPVGPDARRNLRLRRWLGDRFLDRAIARRLGWR